MSPFSWMSLELLIDLNVNVGEDNFVGNFDGTFSNFVIMLVCWESPPLCIYL